MNPVSFELDNEKYQLIPHTGFEAINLYRKVNGAVGNMVNALPKGGVDGASSFAAIAAAFEGYGDDEFRILVETTLKNVTVVTPGKKNVSLSDMDAIAAHFDGRLGGMYSLLFEVWDREKMLPFELAPATGPNGNGTTGTPTSGDSQTKTTQTANGSEK